MDLVLLLVVLAQLARQRIDQPGQVEHRIGKILECRRAAFVELFAQACLFELCAGDQLDGAFPWTFPGQHPPHGRIVRTELPRQVGE